MFIMNNLAWIFPKCVHLWFVVLLIFDKSTSPLVCVSPCLCMCLFLSAVCCMCLHACVWCTWPVNLSLYQTITSPKSAPENTLSENAPLRKMFSCIAWPRCVRCMSCLFTNLSPSSSSTSHGHGHMTPDTSDGSKRLSLLQAVAQGYYPIIQEDTEQETCQGNQST